MTGIRTETGVWLDISPDAEFELSIENPLLRDDRIPSSWSTDISLPPTPLNKRVLGYMGALMSEPAVKKLKATIEAGGLGIFEGTLEYDSIDENGNLLYTFSARNLDDDWDIKIHELPGLLYGQNSGHDYDSLMSALKAGEIDGVSLPLIINESLVGDTACIDRLDMGDWRPGTGTTRPGTGGSGNRRRDGIPVHHSCSRSHASSGVGYRPRRGWRLGAGAVQTRHLRDMVDEIPPQYEDGSF